MEDADVSQKVLKQLYKTEFNKLTPEDIESVKRVIYKYMNQSGASGYEVKMLVNPELSEEKSQFVNNVISNYMDKYNMYVHDDGITYSKKHREDMMMHQPEQSFILHFINTVNIFYI